MTLQGGSRLGNYEILEPIGAGGTEKCGVFVVQGTLATMRATPCELSPFCSCSLF